LKTSSILDADFGLLGVAAWLAICSDLQQSKSRIDLSFI
jgi:hypothetical protein